MVGRRTPADGTAATDYAQTMPSLRPPLRLSLALLAPFASLAPTLAQDDSGALEAEEAAASRTFVNARVGAASSNENGRPEVCVEGAPLAVLSVEACGTGAQVWHDDPAPEMAHFRVKGRFLSLALPRLFLQGFAGAGFAELSVGRDQPGFKFNGVTDGLVSTAGPELTLTARALVPMGQGFELISDLNFAGAYLPNADDLITPRSRFQPTLALSIGLGF